MPLAKRRERHVIAAHPAAVRGLLERLERDPALDGLSAAVGAEIGLLVQDADGRTVFAHRAQDQAEAGAVEEIGAQCGF